LNDKLGNITYYDSQGQNEYAMDKPYSQETAVVIDEEISKIIEAEYDRAIDILSNNREKLDALANLLLDKEVIFKENVEEIFGKRPWDKEETEDTAAEVVATEAPSETAQSTEPTEAPTAEETPKEAE
jgi:cell division protease FtsH